MGGETAFDPSFHGSSDTVGMEGVTGRTLLPGITPLGSVGEGCENEGVRDRVNCQLRRRPSSPSRSLLRTRKILLSSPSPPVLVFLLIRPGNARAKVLSRPGLDGLKAEALGDDGSPRP